MDDIISVIVPIYKVEKYINRCIDSITNQTYKNLDIILVDDGSPDLCGKICDEYADKDSRIRVIHKENGGLSSARNVALDDLKGNWVVCVDSDDYVHPDMIRRLHRAACDNNAEIAICSHYEERGERLFINSRIEDEVIVWDKKSALTKLIYDEEVKNYAWGKIYKSSLFDGVRYPDGRNYEDIATTYLLFDKAERIVKIPDYLYYYLIREDGISFNNSTSSWHKGCHATCLGQQERADYFKKKGYSRLYELAMAALLPYLYSDIRSGYSAGKLEDVKASQRYIRENLDSFYNNKLISDKDKKIISIYLKSENYYSVYIKAKDVYSKVNKTVKKIKKRIAPQKSSLDFKLSKGKTRRIIYFELPCFDNLGDHAIAYVTEKLLSDFSQKDNVFQLYIVDGWDTEKAISSLKKIISGDDVIVCQGGGNFGSLYDFAEVFRRKVLKAFKNNKIIIMPQTLFYTEDERGQKELSLDKKAVNSCEDIVLFARDSKSYDLMKKHFDCETAQLHDVVSMFETSEFSGEKRNGIVVCLRSDKEGKLSCNDKKKIISICEKISPDVHVTDTCTGYEFDTKIRKSILEKKFRLWGQSKLVVTDRLHGMIFSIITGTTCIVIGNNHHKVLETRKTFKDCEYLTYTEFDDTFEEQVKKVYSSSKHNEVITYSKDFDIVLDKVQG
ncbi:MAG: glycosyltransferase [Butyrivibrio sp.]|nr:glycosyltransferase [Butyrivibrio sp.]